MDLLPYLIRHFTKCSSNFTWLVEKYLIFFCPVGPLYPLPCTLLFVGYTVAYILRLVMLMLHQEFTKSVHKKKRFYKISIQYITQWASITSTL